MDQIDVSVIVTTRNEEEIVGNCLRSIKDQTYPPEGIEIIVVDNDSTDGTTSISRSNTDKVYNHGHNRAEQLNYGARKARGQYIIFPDADMILSEKLIAECVKKCRREECVALYVPERIIGKGFWIKVRDFERSFYNATVIDCVRFVSRDAFLEIGGFDGSLEFGPDDWDFDRRIKETGKTGIIDALLYHNEGEFDLRKYLEKKGNYVGSFDGYVGKWGKGDRIVKKQLGFWCRYLGVFVEDGKWKRLLRHPVLTLGMYFLRVRVGIKFLRSG